MCTHCQEWIKKKWLGAAKQKNLESPSIPTSVLHEYNNLYVKSARLHVAQPLHCGPPSVAAAAALTAAHLNATHDSSHSAIHRGQTYKCEPTQCG